jgi:hypothetical protein
MHEGASRSRDGNVKASAIVARSRIVDAEEKRPCLICGESNAGADKKEKLRLDANTGYVLRAIKRLEAAPCNPILGNENTN